jgi:heptaprenyl diphosphate synthase
LELKKYTRLSLLLALSIVLNIIESYIPFFNIPGLKLGLANIVSLFVILKFSFKDALYLGILRVFLVGMLRTGLFSTTFFFSLSGVILSIIMMYIGYNVFKLSIIGVSIIGSISHCIGQVLMAILLLNNTMIYYLPYLLIFSIPSGIITGIICKKLINYYQLNDEIYSNE